MHTQTYPNIEIIVIDDCGNDQSIPIIKNNFQDKRISIIHNHRNLGAFHSRKNGIQVNICLFVDSDDFISIHLCQTLYSYLKNHREIEILHFGFKYYPSSFFKNLFQNHKTFALNKKILRPISHIVTPYKASAIKQFKHSSYTKQSPL